jgi:hypothetical protein
MLVLQKHKCKCIVVSYEVLTAVKISINALPSSDAM